MILTFLTRKSFQQVLFIPKILKIYTRLCIHTLNSDWLIYTVSFPHFCVPFVYTLQTECQIQLRHATNSQISDCALASQRMPAQHSRDQNARVTSDISQLPEVSSDWWLISPPADATFHSLLTQRYANKETESLHITYQTISTLIL